jgi:threonine dehydrogenase-like Zn-dependent dehydrogenase
MKAAIVEKPGVLVVRDIPTPPVGPYDVLCRMLFGATCNSTDLHVIANELPWHTDYPAVLGHECVGRAVQVGTKVRHLKIGDLITRVGVPAPADKSFGISWGGFCEYGIARDHRAMKEDGLPTEQWNAHRINQIVPPGVSPAAATMIITLRETGSNIQRMGVSRGSSVLVVGSGGVALAFIAHARCLGATRISVVGTKDRRDLAFKAGATDYIDYRATDLLAELTKLQPNGFDFLIDTIGKPEQLESILRAIRLGGMLNVYGLEGGFRFTINLQKIRGNFTIFGGGYDEEEVHVRVVELLSTGAIDASIWLDLDRPYPLDRINDAFEAIRAKKHVKALIQL